MLYTLHNINTLRHGPLCSVAWLVLTGLPLRHLPELMGTLPVWISVWMQPAADVCVTKQAFSRVNKYLYGYEKRLAQRRDQLISLGMTGKTGNILCMNNSCPEKQWGQGMLFWRALLLRKAPWEGTPPSSWLKEKVTFSCTLAFSWFCPCHASSRRIPSTTFTRQTWIWQVCCEDWAASQPAEVLCTVTTASPAVRFTFLVVSKYVAVSSKLPSHSLGLPLKRHTKAQGNTESHSYT